MPSLPKRTTSPCASFLAGLTSACQREPSRRLISVASIFGSVSRPMRRPLELGRDHLGVVHHQLVAGLKPKRKIGNAAVAQDAFRLHHQHPSGIARACRAQRDTGGGKLEIEEIGAHGGPGRHFGDANGCVTSPAIPVTRPAGFSTVKRRKLITHEESLLTRHIGKFGFDDRPQPVAQPGHVGIRRCGGCSRPSHAAAAQLEMELPGCRAGRDAAFRPSQSQARSQASPTPPERQRWRRNAAPSRRCAAPAPPLRPRD